MMCTCLVQPILFSLDNTHLKDITMILLRGVMTSPSKCFLLLGTGSTLHSLHFILFFLLYALFASGSIYLEVKC